MKEGGTNLTITGSGFKRTTTLRVRFASTNPKTEIDIVDATYVDGSTILVPAPTRETAHVSHVSVTNDGATYSALPMSTVGGKRTYLEYTTLCALPSGEWAVDNSTFSACGGATATVLLDGVFKDGQPDGGIFYQGDVYCSVGSTARTSWSHHTTPEFFPGTSSTTLGTDSILSVAPEVQADYNMRVSTNVTYEFYIDTAASFKWRKYAGGMYGSGDYTDGIALTLATAPLKYELDLGVKVSFASATGKTVGDRWTFKSMTRNPHIVEGTYVTDRIVTCPIPAYDPSLNGPPMGYDADPWKVGIQQEIKVSNRGNDTFSPPTYTNAADGRSVTGATETHGKGSIKLPFNEDIKLFVQGRYEGEDEVVYELVMTSATTFKWRKYLYHTAASGAYTTGAFTVTTEPQLLDLGVYVKWATTAGKAAGDKWSFVAYTYWSTPYSRVAFTDAGIATTGEDAKVVVQGVYTGAASYTYEVMTQVDQSEFKWRKYAYGAAAGGAWSAPLPQRTTFADLEEGIKVRWLTQYGKQSGDVWQFNAFAGHVVTYLAAAYLSTAQPAAANTIGDPRTPTVTGPYLGDTSKTFRVQIAGSCTTSCSEFRWRTEGGYDIGAWSANVVMASAPMVLLDGVYITFGLTSGYQHGNEYTFIAKPMPTSMLPVYPEPPIGIAVTGTYHESHDVPTHDLVYTLLMTSGTTFKWRQNTGAFSADVIIDTTKPMVIGANGLNLTFAATGFATGARYIISSRTHIPRVTNVTTTHHGNRHLPVVGRPIPNPLNYKHANNGSLVGDVVPYANNVGITRVVGLPTDGDSRAAVVSDHITAGATPGYLVKEFPEVYVEIFGNATVGAVSSTRPLDMTVSGAYTGSSSLVYEVQADTASTFQFRTYAKGATSASASTWSAAAPMPTSAAAASALSSGLKVHFSTASFVAGTSWQFTAEYGHTFKFRDASQSQWSREIEIDGTEQELAGGVSVRFLQLSGFTTGDNFRITNRTVDAWGTYWGREDNVYYVNMTGSPRVSVVRLERAAGSGTTGLAATMAVAGTYANSVTYSYEVVITDGSSTPTKFKWRKYLRGYKSGAGPYAAAVSTSLSQTYLDDGLSVSWGSVAGHTAGDTWSFTAHAGDEFIWKKGGLGDDADASNWSQPRSISHVGLVEADANNVGAQVANTHILSFGAYTGAHDATVVIEMLPNGKSFRWKKGPYNMEEGRSGANTTNTHEGAHEYAAVDSGNEAYVEGGGDDIRNTKAHLESYGAWSAAVSISADWPIHLVDGVWVQFSTASGWSVGDLFYVPAKTTTHHELSDGVFVTFGATSGYAVDDQWSIPVRYAYAARGPMGGNTEITVHGSGFLPGDKLKCKLWDARTELALLVPAQYDSPTRVRCVTPAHPRDTISDAEFTGLGQSGMTTGGVYSGGQDSTFYVEATGTASFRWRQQEVANSQSEASAAWSASTPVSTGFTNLTDGVRIKFSHVGGYTAGDTWAFKAVHFDAADQKEAQLGTVRPGVLKKVYVSNDDGATWSKDDHGLSTFLYSDVFVSVSGHDVLGDGTCANPYKTIQKAVAAALSEPRSWFKKDSGVTGERGMGATGVGLERHINRDQVMLSMGRYEGTGNNGIAPLGKMLIMTATSRAEAVIDCSMTDSSDTLHMADRNQPLGPTHRGSITFEGVNVENCYNRQTYTLPPSAAFGRRLG